MVENFCMVLFSFFFFFLQFVFISLRCKIFCDSGFFVFFYKTLALKDSNTIQTTATNPHLWGPSRAGDSGGGVPLAVLWLFSWCLVPVGRCGVLGQVELYSSSMGRWSQERIPEQRND